MQGEEDRKGPDEWKRMKKGRREGGEIRKGEMEMVRGRKSEQVAENVTAWVEVRRRTRGRAVQEGREDEGGKSCRTVQIFVKVDGSKTFPLDMSPDDKVSDVMKRIPNNEDAYVTMGGRVLTRSEKLRSCGISDRCTNQVTNRMQGGRHKDKKSKAE